MKRDPFDPVRAIGTRLSGVEETTAWGAPTLKVGGKMFVCMATHKSAEPNTLVVKMDFAQRDALIEEAPATYYLKDHYVNYPCVLVRLSRVHPDALRDLGRVPIEGRREKGKGRTFPFSLLPSPFSLLKAVMALVRAACFV